MADKLMLVISNARQDSAVEFVPPLLQATVAAAMGYEVEVLFTGQAGKMAVVGEAEKLVLDNAEHKTLYEHIKDAKQAGVVFKVCTPALQLWGDELIPEIDETVGGAYLIQESMDDSVVTFTY